MQTFDGQDCKNVGQCVSFLDASLGRSLLTPYKAAAGGFPFEYGEDVEDQRKAASSP